tara:strand:+ start:10930 stop:11661 length:732 start_codon:yes stop_codon:yes gene_type:complete
MFVTFIIAFNLGLVSTAHCIGMCGGILSALIIAPEEVKTGQQLAKFKRSLAYNSGRICSYSIAGFLAGFIGKQFVGFSQEINMHFILQCIAAFVLIALALNILGLFSSNKLIESLGMKLWRFIQPFGKHFYPITTQWRALFMGMLWGWLPCGLVYSALLLSLTMGTSWQGMLVMFLFGLGTLPGMLTAGYFSGYLNTLKKNIKFKWITSVLLILIAISLPVSTLYFSKHHQHTTSASTEHQHH